MTFSKVKSTTWDNLFLQMESAHYQTQLDTIKKMPVLKDTKEIKEFLGLTGYYTKFIPIFAYISKPLTTFMKKEMILI